MTTIIDRGHGVALHVEEGKPKRQCGGCTLCCKLLPVAAVDKAAGERCKHQSHARGCKVYARLGSVSPECSLWSCRWKVNDDTADLSRPDRSHYVVDMLPDFVTLRNDETGEAQHIEVVQIWVDPKYPDAHRDPALRAYLERRAKDNVVGIVRWNNEAAMVLFPPALSENRQWNEKRTDLRMKTHSFADVARALGGRPESPRASCQGAAAPVGKEPG